MKPAVYLVGAGPGDPGLITLRDAGIPYEIVPGITTGLAAAAYCEIPITHHDDDLKSPTLMCEPTGLNTEKGPVKLDKVPTL